MTSPRRLLDAPEILVAPGAYDGTGARLVRAGAAAMHVEDQTTALEACYVSWC